MLDKNYFGPVVTTRRHGVVSAGMFGYVLAHDCDDEEFISILVRLPKLGEGHDGNGVRAYSRGGAKERQRHPEYCGQCWWVAPEVLKPVIMENT